MSKELTPLEALERLKVTFNSLIESNEFVNNDISIIEKSLKALEIIKKGIYVGYSGAIAITSWGFDNYDLLKEVLL